MWVSMAKYKSILKIQFCTSCLDVPMNGSGGSIFTELLVSAYDMMGRLDWAVAMGTGAV